MLKDVFHSYRLSLCEKALAEYLETKRVAFPRFYFISSADLLDILSKGAQPAQVIYIYIFFLKVAHPMVAKECHIFSIIVRCHLPCHMRQEVVNNAVKMLNAATEEY